MTKYQFALDGTLPEAERLARLVADRAAIVQEVTVSRTGKAEDFQITTLTLRFAEPTARGAPCLAPGCIGALALLRRVEWVEDSEGGRWCPVCDRQEPTPEQPPREESYDAQRTPQMLHRVGHAPTCELDRLLHPPLPTEEILRNLRLGTASMERVAP